MMGYRGENKGVTMSINKGDLTNHVNVEPEKGHAYENSINVAIAAAISAYARVYMCKPRETALYTDTDSVVG